MIPYKASRIQRIKTLHNAFVDKTVQGLIVRYSIDGSAAVCVGILEPEIKTSFVRGLGLGAFVSAQGKIIVNSTVKVIDQLAN